MASGSQTSAAYRRKITAAFAQNVPGAGSATTPAYKQGITAGFAALKAGAAAPSAGATPPTAFPVDPVYDQQVGGLVNKRDTTLAGLEQQKTGGLLDYGYSATYDDKGNATALAFDPSNPYSQAALARKHYQQAKTGTTNSLAAGGQLYSGAMVNAQDANDSGFAVGEDARQKGLLRFLAGNRISQTGANNDYELGMGDAAAGRVGRAPSSPLWDPSTGTAAQQPAEGGKPLTATQADPGNWVVGTFTQKGVKYHRLGNGKVVKA